MIVDARERSLMIVNDRGRPWMIVDPFHVKHRETLSLQGPVGAARAVTMPGEELVQNDSATLAQEGAIPCVARLASVFEHPRDRLLRVSAARHISEHLGKPRPCQRVAREGLAPRRCDEPSSTKFTVEGHPLPRQLEPALPSTLPTSLGLCQNEPCSTIRRLRGQSEQAARLALRAAAGQNWLKRVRVGGTAGIPSQRGYTSIVSARRSNRMGRISTSPPGVHAGNIDNKDFVAGPRCSCPYTRWVRCSVSDAHAAQGQGEVDLSAIEIRNRGKFQFIVRSRRRQGKVPVA